MATTFSYTILFVADMQRSIGFYRDLIGLTLKMESPEWSEFAMEGCTLALHKAADVPPLPHPQLRHFPAGHAHTGFSVDDIDAIAARMSEAQVEYIQPVRLEDFGGRLGVWRDPDGIPVSVMSFG